MIDVLEPESAPERGDAFAWLSAIVDHSQDAILSKTLDGIITSWNGAAERLFGFTREEAVGRPISLIIPEDRLHEEEAIIARLRAGLRVDRLETIRRRKDGSPVHIEVSVSPVRDAAGRIIGASKIARDIGERLRHAEEQRLIVREMHHRIQNILSVVQALVSVGRRRAADVESFADELTARIQALGAVQHLVLKSEADQRRATTLDALLRTLLAPYGEDRIKVAGGALPVSEQAVTSLALLLHELATNAAKYGALASSSGRLRIEVDQADERVVLHWREQGGSAPDEARQGFGTALIRASLRNLCATMERRWDGTTYDTVIEFDRATLTGAGAAAV